MKIRLDPLMVAEALAREGPYVSPRRAARLLGTTPRAAGKVLAWLERLDLAEKVSRHTYKLEPRHVVNR